MSFTPPDQGHSSLLVRLGPGDLEPVRTLAERCFPRKWSQEDFKFFLGAPEGWNFGCRPRETQTDLCAYFLGLKVGKSLDVVSLGVDPAVRRKGMALKLMASMMGSFPWDQVFLEVATDNEPALKLYEKLGFRRLRLRPKYYGGKVDAWAMVHRRS